MAYFGRGSLAFTSRSTNRTRLWRSAAWVCKAGFYIMILEFSLSSGIACVEASVWQRVIYIYIYIDWSILAHQQAPSMEMAWLPAGMLSLQIQWKSETILSRLKCLWCSDQLAIIILSSFSTHSMRLGQRTNYNGANFGRVSEAAGSRWTTISSKFLIGFSDSDRT